MTPVLSKSSISLIGKAAVGEVESPEAAPLSPGIMLSTPETISLTIEPEESPVDIEGRLDVISEETLPLDVSSMLLHAVQLANENSIARLIKSKNILVFISFSFQNKAHFETIAITVNVIMCKSKRIKHYITILILTYFDILRNQNLNLYC